MKKILYGLLLFFIPALVVAATTVPWSRTAVGTITPLYTGDGVVVSASSTIGNGTAAGGLTVSGTATTTTGLILSFLSGTQCLHEVSGVVLGTGSDCGSGGGSSTFGTSSLSALYPVVYTQSSSLAQFSLAFGTTTSNTWAGTQTFTNSPIFSTLGAGTVNSTSGGSIYNTATTSVTFSSPFTTTGTLGALIGGTNTTIACQVASGSQAGCLSSADWTTFNGKGSGTVTSVGLSSTNSTLSIGATPVTTSGTITADLNLAHSNTWSALQIFGANSSTTMESVGGPLYVGHTSTTTIQGDGASTTIMGSLTIATTSQTAFNIQDQFGTVDVTALTASTTGSIFTVAATSSKVSNPIKLFDVDQYGHLTASSTPIPPTVSCSPSGGTITAGSNDTTGDITSGTNSNSCTVTFGAAFAVTPEVFITDSNSTAVADVSARSTTAFTVSLASALSAVNISYFVIMP